MSYTISALIFFAVIALILRAERRQSEKEEAEAAAFVARIRATQPEPTDSEPENYDDEADICVRLRSRVPPDARYGPTRWEHDFLDAASEIEDLRKKMKAAISSSQYYEEHCKGTQEYATMRDKQVGEMQRMVLHVLDKDWPDQGLTQDQFIRQELIKTFGTDEFPWIVYYSKNA